MRYRIRIIATVSVNGCEPADTGMEIQEQMTNNTKSFDCKVQGPHKLLIWFSRSRKTPQPSLTKKTGEYSKHRKNIMKTLKFFCYDI